MFVNVRDLDTKTLMHLEEELSKERKARLNKKIAEVNKILEEITSEFKVAFYDSSGGVFSAKANLAVYEDEGADEDSYFIESGFSNISRTALVFQSDGFIDPDNLFKE